MAKRNIKGLQEFGKIRTQTCEKKVLDALNLMVKNNEKVTISAVARKAGVTNKFIYSHIDLLSTIRRYTEPSGYKKKQTQDSKDSLITCLRLENKNLKKQIKELESREDYRIQNEQLETEIIKLKKELDNALNMALDLKY